MKYLSVCSGMEAASVAWHPLGWKPVGFSEIEPFPCSILKHRFPTTPNYGSLTEYQSWPVGPGAADLLVGGTPCQSFSVAGLRKGLEDPRGNLALVFLGLADRIKPRWIVWENVPGVLSSAGGRDFGSFLGALVELGYGFAYRVLDAQHFGVPQRRRRVFVVACLGDWRAPAEVLLEPDCVRRDPSSRRKKGQGPAAGAEGGVGANGRKWPADTACTLNAAFGQKLGLEDQHALGGASLFVPTKPIVMSSGQTNAAISEDMAHTLNATHETQTVATPIVIDRAAFNQGQNAQYEPHIEESEVMDSLVARGPHAVDQPLPIAFKVRGGGNYSGTKGGEVKPDEKGGTGYLGYEDKTFTVATTQDQWVAAPIPYRKSKRAQSTTDDETWVPADASNTLNNFDLGDTRTTHAVVGAVYENHAQDSRVKQVDLVSIHAKAGTGGGNLPLTQTAMAVRRLTPVECERLQGFPDNWSRIPWKGKPETDCPDGPRYKACGNSMAVPVMRWIGERIATVEASLQHP